MSDDTFRILLIVLLTVFVIAGAALWNTVFRPRGRYLPPAPGPAPRRRPPPLDERLAKMERHPNSSIAWDHPANRGVIDVLSSVYMGNALFEGPAPSELAGTHPDVVQEVYQHLTRKLPEDCRWYLCGLAVLVHPQSGIIFAFGIGSMCVGVRLPQSARMDGGRWLTRYTFSSGGDSIEPSVIGGDWVFEGGGADSPAAGLAAYEYAGSL